MGNMKLHLVFSLLFVASFFVAEQFQKLLPTWKDPKVGLLSLVVALIWMASTLLEKLEKTSDDMKVVKDRLERAEHKIRMLEDQGVGA